MTQAEKKQLMKENKCLKCKKIGHFARDCPQETNLWTLKQQLQEKEKIASTVNVLQRTQSKTELKQPRIMQYRGGIVEVKVNGHPAMAIVDQQTQGGDLISAQYCQTYEIPTKPLGTPVTISGATKGSRSTINDHYIVEIDYGGHKEKRQFYVANLAQWDMILGEPALRKLRATIDVNDDITIIRPSGKKITLKKWGNRSQQITSAAGIVEAENNSTESESENDSNESENNSTESESGNDSTRSESEMSDEEEYKNFVAPKLYTARMFILTNKDKELWLTCDKCSEVIQPSKEACSICGSQEESKHWHIEQYLSEEKYKICLSYVVRWRPGCPSFYRCMICTDKKEKNRPDNKGWNYKFDKFEYCQPCSTLIKEEMLEKDKEKCVMCDIKLGEIRRTRVQETKTW